MQLPGERACQAIDIGSFNQTAETVALCRTCFIQKKDDDLRSASGGILEYCYSFLKGCMPNRARRLFHPSSIFWYWGSRLPPLIIST